MKAFFISCLWKLKTVVRGCVLVSRREQASVSEEVQEAPARGGMTDPRGSQDVTGAQEAEPSQITDNPD